MLKNWIWLYSKVFLYQVLCTCACEWLCLYVCVLHAGGSYFVGRACSLCRARLCTNTQLREAVELWKCQTRLLTDSAISSFLGVLPSSFPARHKTFLMLRERDPLKSFVAVSRLLTGGAQRKRALSSNTNNLLKNNPCRHSSEDVWPVAQPGHPRKRWWATLWCAVGSKITVREQRKNPCIICNAREETCSKSLNI